MNVIDRPGASDPPCVAPTRRPRHRGHAFRLTCALVAALVAAAVLVAGCGGSSSSGGGGVAHINTTSSTANSSTDATSKPNTLAFAKCMRKHGVPNFPDPTSSGQFNLNGINSQSEAFQTAESDCKSLIGGEINPKPITQTPQMQAATLKMAKCMRSHGVPNYPDGPITRSSGINENSPAFQRAFKTCRKYMTGAGAPSSPGGQTPVGSGG